MRLHVRHLTRYAYDEDVVGSYAIARLVPRALEHQSVVEHTLTVEPAPADLTHDVDHHGNTVTYLHLESPHRRLDVLAQSVVQVDERGRGAAEEEPWEQARPRSRPDVPDAWEAIDLTLASPSVGLPAAAGEYAEASLAPGRPLAEAVTDLVHRLHAEFAYEPGTTTVTSTVEDVLRSRAGVCQDFAHVLIACLRAHGIAARYVSGYLATDPPPGRERVLGADATHAWVEVWVPGGPWLALDPTNDQRVGDRYVTVAWGRDYADVPPLKGVIFSEASSSVLTVEVDVVGV